MQSIRQVATPAAVLAYCAAGHTNAEAAAHWGINERTVRKWKARAGGSEPRQLAPTRATETSQIEPPVISHSDIPLQLHIPDHWVARDGVMWRCPRCGELVPPLPGTSGAEWNERGCYLHQVAPLGKTVEDPANNITAEVPIGPGSGPGPALQEAPANVERPGPAPLLTPIGPARPRPVDPWGITAATRLITWGEMHLPAVQLGAGLVITWLVILVAF